MENSLFRSNTYGIGELISQKKRLEVPLYQRNFSWDTGEIDQFLDDIIDAVEGNYSNYFLGSILLTQPREGLWGILDGQQRLTTVSIIYSTIRYLLNQKDKEKDAELIANEFLGVMALGGEYHSRLLLNAENRDIYNEAVVNFCSDTQLSSLKTRASGNKSNLLILHAVHRCRKRLREWFNSKGDQQINSLYHLSEFLEKRVMVVAIEVFDESDAYVAFETLNTRGQDLSALDLVKNYIFSSTKADEQNTIKSYWSTMKDNIGERQADDFLRIFWMGNFGLIQKSRLYSNLKTKFNTPQEAFYLAKKLSDESRIYAAIGDAKHELWQQYSSYTRHLVEILNILKSKQTRPIIFACAKANRIDTWEMEMILWYLVVLTIRFQTIGKRRQGVLEKQCARIALEVSQSNDSDLNYIRSEIEKIMPTDEEFTIDFKKYQEVNSKRALYVLSTIEFFHQRKSDTYEEIWEAVDETIDSVSNTIATHILPRSNESLWIEHLQIQEDEDAEGVRANIGNWMIVTPDTRPPDYIARFEELKQLLSESQFWSTREITKNESWNRAALSKRQNALQVIAAKVWTLKSEDGQNS